MSDEIAIKVENVSKTFRLPHEKNNSVKSTVINFYRSKRTYEKQQALKDVSFEVKKGEFFGIVGRNGSGKSTLLKMLAGIYSPSKGNIQINGKLTPFIELGVGFNPELTGRENVFLNGALLGFNRKEMHKMYKDIVEFAELERFMDQKLKNYSSGMQVRLAFSIAIRADTEILLFDEVLAVGDERFQKKCLTVFRELKQAGKTIILVSHSTADIERFCDRVLVLDKGEQLGEFNAREGTALYQEINNDITLNQTTKATKPKKRWGSGNVSIEKVTVANGAKSVTTGDNLEVKVYLKRTGSTAKSLNINVGIAFYDEDNINISGPNSYDTPMQFDRGEAEIIVQYSVVKLPLNSGVYRITAAVLDDTKLQTYDHLLDVISFRVRSDGTYYGKVILNGSWAKKAA